MDTEEHPGPAWARPWALGAGPREPRPQALGAGPREPRPQALGAGPRALGASAPGPGSRAPGASWCPLAEAGMPAAAPTYYAGITFIQHLLCIDNIL